MIKSYYDFITEDLTEVGGNILNVIHMLSQQTSGITKEMYEQMERDAKSITCVSVYDVFTKDEIKEIMRMVNPKPKQCYENSYHLCSRGRTGKEIKYCEGYMSCFGIPIDHAFNKIGDVYVDITLELALKRDVTKEEYVLLGEWDEATALNAMSIEGCYGEVYKSLFIQKHKEALTR